MTCSTTWRTNSRKPMFSSVKHANYQHHCFRYASAIVVNGTVSESNSQFFPNQDLNRADGDVTVFFLEGNGVVFLEPVHDDWYRATVPSIDLLDQIGGGSHASYQPEEAASPLGCVSQYQFCNPALPEDRQCGPLASNYDAMIKSAPTFGLTEEEIATNDTGKDATSSRYLWLAEIISASLQYTPNIVQSLQAQALVSSQSLQVGVQGPLPNNQWQIDVAHWWATELASLQLAFVSAARGQTDSVIDAFLMGPQDSYQQDFCNSQVGHSLPPSTSL
jgi:hypothetical protein